jgi:hypothetical protein
VPGRIALHERTSSNGGRDRLGEAKYAECAEQLLLMLRPVDPATKVRKSTRSDRLLLGENSLDEHVDRVCIVGPVGPASAVVGMWGVHVVAPSRLLLAIKNDG